MNLEFDQEKGTFWFGLGLFCRQLCLHLPASPPVTQITRFAAFLAA